MVSFQPTDPAFLLGASYPFFEFQVEQAAVAADETEHKGPSTEGGEIPVSPVVG